MGIVCIRMRGKRGWIRILEATVAVLIVSGVMLAVYSGQTKGQEFSISDYSNNLQKQILADIVIEPKMRLDVLRVVDDLPGDPAYDRLDDFVGDRIPDSFGYLLRVCELGNDLDFCKMDSEMFIATIDKDVFVEETVISSDLGSGSDAIYAPKKVRLFFFGGGGTPEGFCRDECSSIGYSLGCSADLKHVVNKSCGEFDGDACSEYNDSFVDIVDTCNSTSLCIGGVCVTSLYSVVTCERQTNILKSGCLYSHTVSENCAGYDAGESYGSCNFGFSDRYRCWNVDSYTTGCGLNPACSGGYSEVSAVPCAGPLPSVAIPSLEFEDVNYSWFAPNHYYNHTRVISEHAQVGFSFTSEMRVISIIQGLIFKINQGYGQNFHVKTILPYNFKSFSDSSVQVIFNFFRGVVVYPVSPFCNNSLRYFNLAKSIAA